jgi:purine-binding chemotaxis protein CheW
LKEGEMSWQQQNKTEQVQSAPDVVVQDYLDFMLRSVTLGPAVDAPAPVDAVIEALVSNIPIIEPVAPLIPAVIVPASAPVVSVEAVVAPDLQTVSPEQIIEAPIATLSQAPESKAISNDRPSWSNEPFECLMFQVLGLKLGAALVELGGIARVSEDLTPIFGQSNWFMGLLRWNGRNIKVIDTARLIMPERLKDLAVNEHPEYGFVLLIEGTDWGLGIDAASESVLLRPEEVRWRISKQTRPWLAGTALERMCALLDMQTVSKQLVEQERLN